jgi:transposase
MNAYSEDLRNKFVGALRRGMTKSEAARTFSVSRSSVKSYAKLVEEGRPLAPKKRPGSKLKMFMAISSPLYIMVRVSQSRCVWVGG